jgi:hypothetical protein
LIANKTILTHPLNGLAHLPPIIARQLTLEITFSAKWPPRFRAEGGQVEPVLGRFCKTILNYGFTLQTLSQPFFSVALNCC